ncbi:MAG: hypothetical protein ACJATA_000157 [Sphingobacteriales bacterium]|jgi:hypothetical protein
MKRIHLFEFEDFSWFPDWIRVRMTRFIVTMHKLLGSKAEIATLLEKALAHSKNKEIYDLCSGGGGPMLDVYELLKSRPGLEDVKLTLTDLYPNKSAAAEIKKRGDSNLDYSTYPVDATAFNKKNQGVRTMICSLHHMRPEKVKEILKDTMNAGDPFLAFEISDNSFPKWIWWISFPINIITTLLITPFIRPMSWQQLVFTYIIPVLPILIAWDGALSNARTYTLDDLDIVLKGINKNNYIWEKGVIKRKGNKLYLMGLPN